VVVPHRASHSLPEQILSSLTSAGAHSLVSVALVFSDGNTESAAVTIGVASFFLMPQSPAKTKSWWNPKGYFTKKEEKIIVNSGKPSSTRIKI
jgi:hypothetical protein